MEIRYEIVLHPAVIQNDIPRLSKVWRNKIRDTIRQKLKTHPELFGKPLHQNLKGCRRLRVGDYRVVFQIKGSEVTVVAIVHRSSEYKGIKKRL